MIQRLDLFLLVFHDDHCFLKNNKTLYLILFYSIWHETVLSKFQEYLLNNEYLLRKLYISLVYLAYFVLDYRILLGNLT